MVPLGSKLKSSHRLSLQTTLASGTVWPQFAMQVLTGVANPQFGGRRAHEGSEIGPLCRPTSYKFPIVAIGLFHRFRSALGVPDRRTDRQTGGRN